jgi:hypothetical protein
MMKIATRAITRARSLAWAVDAGWRWRALTRSGV